MVNCKDADGEKEIEVQKETWRNVKYTVDEKKSKIEEEVAGSFTQYTSAGLGHNHSQKPGPYLQPGNY